MAEFVQEKLTDAQVIHQLEHGPLGDAGSSDFVGDDVLAASLEDQYKLPAYDKPHQFTYSYEDMLAEDEPLLEAGEPEKLLEAGDAADGARFDFNAVGHDEFFAPTEPNHDDDAVIERNLVSYRSDTEPQRTAPRHAAEYHLEDDAPEIKASAESVVDTYDALVEKAVSIVDRRRAAVEKGDATSAGAIDDFETFQELCKKAEAAGVSAKSLDLIGKFFAMGYDADKEPAAAAVAEPSAFEVPIELKTTTGEIAQIKTESVDITPFAPEEADRDEGIDDMPATDEPVSANSVVGRPEGETAYTMEDDEKEGRLKNWWSNNRDAVKKPFGLKFWADKWDGLTDSYLRAQTRVVTAVHDFQEDDYTRRLMTQTPEEIQRSKNKFRVGVMLGITALVVADKALNLNTGIDHHVGALSGSGGGSPLEHLSGSGNHGGTEALGMASTAPHAETNDIKLPPGVTVGHVEITTSSAPVGEVTPVHHDISDHALPHTGMEHYDVAANYPSDTFDVHTGNGPIDIAERMHHTAADWKRISDGMYRDFPNVFYNDGGDIRFDHVGELPKAVQQAMIDRLKG